MKLRLLSLILCASALLTTILPQSLTASPAISVDRGHIQADITPYIALDKWGGPVGTLVTATCRGFSPGVVISFSYVYGDNATPVGSETAGANGECSLKITIPPSPQGINSITARNNPGQVANVVFNVIPAVSIDPPRAASGETVNVRGSGFTINDRISVFIDDVPLNEGQVNETGSCVVTFTVPLLRSGINLVEVRDITGEVRWLELTIAPKISIDKTTGEVGTRVNLTGSGFGGNSEVQVKFDDRDIAVVDTDVYGKFATTFSVPAVTAGSHNIIVVDGEHLQALIFTIESIPPAIPEIVSPRNKQLTNQPVTLDWGSVYDVSEPVSYDLQIAYDANFNIPAIIRTGLTQSQYTLTAGEQLLPNRRWDYYYWRVNARDSAGNVSDWSKPASFYVPPRNKLPLWSAYLLFGLIALIISAFGILLLRIFKPENKKPAD
ncbi:MAG: hypothetical protein PHE50_04925 [Dehalococcoidales bacterium]|nr:hypothetical protein [Dehalococcoidales bacterium]